MAKIKLLTTRQVNTLSVGFHSDVGNLYLRVGDGGSGSWVVRYKQEKSTTKRPLDRVFEIGLGVVVSHVYTDSSARNSWGNACDNY